MRLCLKRNEARERRAPELLNIAFSTIVLVYGILLGFLIVTVWSDYREAKQSVITEASEIITAAYDVQQLPEPTRRELHEQLRTYTEQVITSEWPQMDRGTARLSPKTLAIFNGLWATCQQQRSATECARWQTDLSTLSERRVSRLMSATGDLPSVLWFVLLCGAVIIGCRCLVFFPRRIALHVLTSAVLLGSIALSLWVLLLINNPFVGDLQVSKDPLHYALQVIESLPK
jgi:Protein of unknown function (DUF4239)